MSEGKLPCLNEAIERLDQLFSVAFSIDHPAILDWSIVRFALKGNERSRICLVTGEEHRWSPSGECCNCSVSVESTQRIAPKHSKPCELCGGYLDSDGIAQYP